MKTELLTVSEAARLLGKTRKTVYEWVASGRLPVARRNGDSRTYLRRVDVDRLRGVKHVEPVEVDENAILRIETAATIQPERVQLLVRWEEDGAAFETDLLASLDDESLHPVIVKTVTSIIRSFVGLPQVTVVKNTRRRYQAGDDD